MNFTERFLSFFSFNLGTKLISVIIAIVLWIVVLGSRNVEVTKDIPLEVITPTDLVAANEIPEKISFRLSGPKAFLRAILDRREDPIRVNLSGAKPGLVTYRFFADNIRLPIGVKVLAVNPTAILIKLETVKRKEVPVNVELRGVAPEGFRIVKTQSIPSEIKLKGAESRIEGVSQVSTHPIDVSDLRQTLKTTAQLDLARHGVQLDGTPPQVVIEIEATSPNYKIKNVDIRVLTSHKFTLNEKSVMVLVRVDPKDLKTLDRSRVYAVIDLRGKPKGKYTESVQVTLPEGVGLVKTIPEKVNVTLH